MTTHTLDTYVKTLTTEQVKTACKSFYAKAEKSQDPVDMASFNATFDELKGRLPKREFELFAVGL